MRFWPVPSADRVGPLERASFGQLQAAMARQQRVLLRPEGSWSPGSRCPLSGCMECGGKGGARGPSGHGLNKLPQKALWAKGPFLRAAGSCCDPAQFHCSAAAMAAILLATCGTARQRHARARIDVKQACIHMRRKRRHHGSR